MNRPKRETADISGYPDLVVIYLGMRVRSPRGLLTVFKFGPRIRRSVAAGPDGLLRHEMVVWGLYPPHLGMRQYWRDFDSLERWARSDPHAAWWRELWSNMAGTGFWHETYFLRGGMESVFLEMPPTGLTAFAPAEEARRSLFSARRRMRLADTADIPAPVSEDQLYG